MHTILQVVRWTPRITSILYVVFLSLFALDVFSEYSGFALLLPLGIHLIPSIIFAFITAIAWRYPLVGAMTFCGFAGFYIWDIGLSRSVSWYVTIALPSLLTGLFYLVNFIFDRKYRKHKA